MAGRKEKNRDAKAEALARALAERWQELIADTQAGAMPQDISALMQQALRDSYLETNKDLQFHADKVRYFNSLKKAVRDEISNARRALGRRSGSKDCAGADEPVEPYVSRRFETFPTLDEDCRPRVVATEGDALDTRGALVGYIDDLERTLASVGDDAQLANIDLQSKLQSQQQTMQMMSNIMKSMHDTAMAVIRNLR